MMKREYLICAKENTKKKDEGKLKLVRDTVVKVKPSID